MRESDYRLRECPFCGGKGLLRTINAPGDFFGKVIVGCETPGCLMYQGGKNISLPIFAPGTAENAVAAWNYREKE